MFFNSSQPPSQVCNASFAPDADIAGPGVMLSFIANAFATIAGASVVAFHPDEHWKKAGKKLLGSLADLQIFTGTAIVVAGLGKLSGGLSFYHAHIVIEYWWLTLNSFWAARAEYSWDGAGGNGANGSGLRGDEWRLRARRIMAFLCVVMLLVFYAITICREMFQWDSLSSGRCYFALIPPVASWVVWSCAFFHAIVLLMTLFEGGNKALRKGKDFLRRHRDSMLGCWNETRDAIVTVLEEISADTSKICIRQVYDSGRRVVVLVFLALDLGLVSFCELWVYGAGIYPLGVFWYVFFAFLNTSDLVYIKIHNQDLLYDSENSWGFGQILPVVLLASVGVSALDAWKLNSVAFPTSV